MGVFTINIKYNGIFIINIKHNGLEIATIREVLVFVFIRTHDATERVQSLLPK